MAHKHPSKPHILDRYKTRFIEKIRDEKRLLTSTVESYTREIDLFFKLHPGTTPAENIDNIKLTLRRLSPATQWRKIIVWRSFLNECPAPWDQLLDKISLPKLRSKLPLFLTESEAFRLESVCYKDTEPFRNRLFLALALEMGLRLSEILQLKFKNFSEGWVSIQRKGNKEQRLPVSHNVNALLKTWQKECFGQPDDWLFPGRTSSRPLSSRSAQLLIKNLARKAHIEKPISPHSLRHTFASTLASRGANLAALKEILGHQRLSTTERYLHVTPEHLRETFSLLNRKLSDKKGD